MLFFKTQLPIDPVHFVYSICDDAAKNPKGRKHRFLNRLTPMTCMARATEKDLEELARQVLKKDFQLVGGEEEDKGDEKGVQAACSVSFPFLLFRAPDFTLFIERFLFFHSCPSHSSHSRSGRPETFILT